MIEYSCCVAFVPNSSLRVNQISGPNNRRSPTIPENQRQPLCRQPLSAHRLRHLRPSHDQCTGTDSALSSREEFPVRSKRLSFRVASATAAARQPFHTARTKQAAPSRKAGPVSAFSASHAQDANDSSVKLEEARLHAAMRAVAAGPGSNNVFLVMVNQAAAVHHLPLFLKSLRLLPVGDQRLLLPC